MKNNVFSYEGYEIPINLVNLTGGGTDTWDTISKGHIYEYQQYCPINPEHTVVEIGCGVGRDAIQLTKILQNRGAYYGIDIIKPSIEWCQQNITKRFPNFTFIFYDINSQIHNPNGAITTKQIKLPLESNTVDRIILQSVFTHMFEEDIIHYLNEFRRILKPNGKVFASFFITDKESLKLAKKTNLSFKYRFNKYCYINDKKYPEGAVGYTPIGLKNMLAKSKMYLDQPIHRGLWCGRKGVTDGQDIVILKPKKKRLIEKIKDLF